MRRRGTTSVAIAAAVAVSLLGGVANAADPDKVIEGGPSRLLLTTGAATFAFGYLSALYVGATSAAESDRALLLPFAGPWAALAARDRCATEEECGTDPTYRTLLVADGIVQAAGAAQVALAFVFREVVPAQDPRIKPGAAVSSLQISPARMRGGVGITMTGLF